MTCILLVVIRAIGAPYEYGIFTGLGRYQALHRRLHDSTVPVLDTCLPTRISIRYLPSSSMQCDEVTPLLVCRSRSVSSTLTRTSTYHPLLYVRRRQAFSPFYLRRVFENLHTYQVLVRVLYFFKPIPLARSRQGGSSSHGDKAMHSSIANLHGRETSFSLRVYMSR